jgi:hypothetical protein
MAIAGITKNIKVAEGVSVATPSVGVGATSGSLVTFADDAAYVTAKGSAATEGDIYQNTTDNTIHYYNGSAWVHVVDESADQTMTNKTIDADNNTISNLAHGAEVDDPSSGVHGVTGSVMGTTDTQTTTNKTLSDGTSYDFSDVAITANTFAKPAKTVARITSGTGPLNTISGGSDGEILVIENKTGATFSIANASASGGFLTGTGNNIDLADDASVTLIYNSSDTYWSVIGGSGGAGGGLSTEIKTSDFTASKDKHYLCDTTAGAITVTLPAVADASVIRFSDLDKNFGTNNLIFAPDGSDTIDEKTSYTLRDDSAWIQIAGDAASSNWIADKSVIAGNGAILSEWESFDLDSLMTISTNVNWTGHKRQIGNDLEIIGQGEVVGAVNSAFLSMTVPDSLTINDTVLGSPSSYEQVLGEGSIFDGGSGIRVLHPVRGQSNTTVNFLFENDTAKSLLLVSEVSPIPVLANGDSFSFRLKVPIAEWQGSGTTNVNSDAIKKTKVVDESIFSLSGPTGWVTDYANVWLESDSEGVCRLFGTAEGTCNAQTGTNSTITTNVKFTADAPKGQPIAVQSFSSGGGGISEQIDTIRCLSNSSDIFIGYSGVSDPTKFTFNFGGVVLEEAPSWMAANLEKNPAVGVEGATPDRDGLVTKDDQAIGGVKTFENGAVFQNDTTFQDVTTFEAVPTLYKAGSNSRMILSSDVGSYASIFFNPDNTSSSGFSIGTRSTSSTTDLVINYATGPANSNGILITQQGTVEIDDVIVNTPNLHLDGSTNTSSGNVLMAADMNSGSGNGSTFISFERGGSQIGRIWQNAATSVAYATTSDERLKENLRPFNALGYILEMNPTRYTWKQGKEDGIGFIAQELFEVFPDAVCEGGDDVTKQPWSIDYVKLIPVLTKAIQEQQVIIDDLKSRIETLEG